MEAAVLTSGVEGEKQQQTVAMFMNMRKSQRDRRVRSVKIENLLLITGRECERTKE
jgi:hypothetical protein